MGRTTNMLIELDVDKGVEENASRYFDQAKKAKRKLEGARKALAVSLKRREDLARKSKEKNALIKAENEERERKRKRKERKAWYESFRWFISSEGFLVVGGRDATTNEIVIKKHAESGDMVFHTDMAGSPFFVVKTEGKKVGEATIREAAQATISFSRAWKAGLVTTRVFHVSPDQVTKEAQAGEYLAKGAFMIRGKTNYVDVEMGLALGIHEGRVMCGPPAAVKAHCQKTLLISQGNTKPSSAAKLVQKELGGELDEIIRSLPSGDMAINHS